MRQNYGNNCLRQNAAGFKLQARANVMFYCNTVADAFGQRHLIGILQFSAKGNAPGNGGNFYGNVFELFANVIDGGIALDVWAKGKYDFFDLLCFNPFYQCINGKLVGAHAIKRRNNTTQYVVKAIELLGTFYCNHVPDGFHHANGVIAPHAIAANIAQVCICNVKTTPAKFYFIPHAGNAVAEVQHIVFGPPKQMQYEAQGCFFANAREFGKFIHSIFQ